MDIGAAIGGVFRHLLTTGGGMLVGNGVLTETQAQTGVGAVMALFGLGWSLWNKRA